MLRRLSSCFVIVLAAQAIVACGPERPPQPDADGKRGVPQAAVADPYFSPDADQFVITYAGEKGEFADCTTLAEVPEAARARVGVNVFGKPAPAGRVWVTDLSAPEPDGRYALESIPRDEFETELLGTGRASAFELPADLDAMELPGTREAPVIVYKTSWCGVCKQVEAYLQKKGVEYIAKDIETDRAAAAELQAKAKQAGVPTGSVPMIDVGGELLRGFDRKRLDKLL
ncbi:MAG TPA: glutaredoxin domain-containing protein [Enhygromyxa sp.]|nr:glutaredoxin domain-containing protein [Enhygromyxa sp.]